MKNVLLKWEINSKLKADFMKNSDINPQPEGKAKVQINNIKSKKGEKSTQIVKVKNCQGATIKHFSQ